MAIRRIEGLLHLASEGRYAILVGRFNSFVVEHLLEGAIDTLKRHGVSEDAITVIHAPGRGNSNRCEKISGFKQI